MVERGIPVKTVSFPDYEKPWSCLVRMYLDGQFGSRPEDVSAYAASGFFAMDRFASYRTSWQKDYEAGTVILCDRYVGSNAIHQSVKLPREEWDAYLDWLFDFEYHKLGLPEPSANSVSGQNASGYLQKTHRPSATAGTRGKRISMKKNLQYLLSCHEAAGYVANRCGWRVVECCDGKKLLAREEVARRVEAALSDLLHAFPVLTGQKQLG